MTRKARYIPPEKRPAGWEAAEELARHAQAEAMAIANKAATIAAQDVPAIALRQLLRDQAKEITKSNHKPPRGARVSGSCKARFGPRNGIFAAPSADPETDNQRVYVIGCVGHPIKIGIAKDVKVRLSALQTSSPQRLREYFSVEVRGGRAREVESLCHKHLSEHRLNGEWFNITPDHAVETVKAIVATL